MVLLVIIIVIVVVFCIMKSRKYKYHVNENGTITIDKYLGHETDVVITDMIKGIEVTEVGALCFYENTKIRSVDIPPTIQIIEKDDKKDAFLIVGDEILIDYPDIEIVEIPYGVKYDAEGNDKKHHTCIIEEWNED